MASSKHPNGVQAYNSLTGSAFHSNGVQAYNSLTGNSYTSKGILKKTKTFSFSLGEGIELQIFPIKISVYGRKVNK